MIQIVIQEKNLVIVWLADEVDLHLLHLFHLLHLHHRQRILVDYIERLHIADVQNVFEHKGNVIKSVVALIS